MRTLDLVAVDVEGWTAWLPADADDPEPDNTAGSVHLLPHFDPFVVGSFPRSQLIAPSGIELIREGRAANFAVLLVDRLVSGFWECKIRKSRLEVRVDAFVSLTEAQQSDIAR
ncbi:MAG: winged helix DNA-binding domain-containing protein [Chloroflexi bacterium]|nr:winged helix DNA-binding domain-containing protein [Chloroflexota bacterium]MBV9899201.1 winged helix DNA-binding domain-containing protein [Chloroflexota bacterium]